MQFGYLESEKKTKLHKRISGLLTLAVGLLLGAASFAAFLGILQPATGLFGAGEGLASPVAGMVSVWNDLADRVGNSAYVLLPKYALAEEAARGRGIFFLLLLALSLLLGWAVVRSKNTWFLLVWLFVWALFSFAFGLYPSLAGGILLGGSLLLACAWMRCLQRGMAAREAGGLFLPIAGGFLALSLAALLAGTGLDGWTFPLAGQAGGALRAGIASARYGSGSLPNGKLNELDGESLQKARNEETALVVSMEAPDALYLRGFVGESYGPEGWTHLDEKTYYSLRDRFYGIHQDGFLALTQAADAHALTGGEGGKSLHGIEITTKGADRSHLYLPYEAAGLSEIGRAKNCADAYLAPTGLFGARTASFLAAENTTGSWTDEAAGLYAADSSQDLDRYFRDESIYNVFAYEAYTALPQASRQLAYEITGYDSRGQASHPGYRETIESVRGWLDENFIESYNFPAPEEGSDAAEAFVSRHMGGDVHYATMAAILFRSYGIPARYVEGYLITPEDRKEADRADQSNGDAGRILVPQSRMHAWPEIYIDGYGWVPVEVTPAYYGLMPEADLTRGLEEEWNWQGQRDAASYDPGQDGSENAGQERPAALVHRIIIILLAALILVLLLLIAARLLAAAYKMWKRKRYFKDPDARVAVCAIYGDMIGEGMSVSEEVDRLGSRAAYSREEITGRDRDFMQKAWDAAMKEKRKTISLMEKGRRLWTNRR